MGTEFQIRQPRHRLVVWTLALKDELQRLSWTLAKPGEQHFQGLRLRRKGGPVALREDDRIVIAGTAASIDAIPASHSIGVEARDKLGGRLVLDFLVREAISYRRRARRFQDRGVAEGRQCRIDQVLALGGGSPIPSTTTASSACSRSRARPDRCQRDRAKSGGAGLDLRAAECAGLQAHRDGGSRRLSIGGLIPQSGRCWTSA